MTKHLRWLIGLVAFIACPVLAETDYKAMEVVDAIQKGKDTKDQIKVLRVQGAATVGGALAVTGALTAGSVVPTTAIAYANLALSNSVTSLDIKNGDLVDADVNASAAIAGSKLNLTSGTGDITMASPKVFSNGGTVKTSGDFVFTPSDVSAVINNQALAIAARSYVRVAAAAAEVTNTLVNPVVGMEGQLLTLVNNSGAGTNVVFTRAANLALGAASRVLGPGDALQVIAVNAVYWAEVGFTDNTLGP